LKQRLNAILRLPHAGPAGEAEEEVEGEVEEEGAVEAGGEEQEPTAEASATEGKRRK